MYVVFNWINIVFLIHHNVIYGRLVKSKENNIFFFYFNKENIRES